MRVCSIIAQNISAKSHICFILFYFYFAFLSGGLKQPGETKYLLSNRILERFIFSVVATSFDFVGYQKYVVVLFLLLYTLLTLNVCWMFLLC